MMYVFIYIYVSMFIYVANANIIIVIRASYNFASHLNGNFVDFSLVMRNIKICIKLKTKNTVIV